MNGLNQWLFYLFTKTEKDYFAQIYTIRYLTLFREVIQPSRAVLRHLVCPSLLYYLHAIGAYEFECVVERVNNCSGD